MEPSGGKPSKVEGHKIDSQYLHGFVAEEVGPDVAIFSEGASSVLKFHGSYQQDDRDLRKQRQREGQPKAYGMMVRSRVPGGRVTAEQYLAEDALARTVGNGTLRITTRQGFQLHGVAKDDMRTVISTINRAYLSTLAACGDVERNVLCCSAPLQDKVRAAMGEDCASFASHFAPRSSAYWDIWLDGERIANPFLPPAGPVLLPTPGDDETEPIYGRAYLPRKFKTAFSLPYDNCTDIHANDLGFLAVVEDGELIGYNVLVGGGLGTTPSAGKTFPALAQEMAYVPRSEVKRVGEAVVKIFRDFGNRSDRKRARLKYLIYDVGMPAFKAKVEEYLGNPIDDPRDNPVTDVDDHLGWHEQGDGKLFIGISVENGRIEDTESHRVMTALRTIVARFQTPVRTTCQQNIMLTNLDPSSKREVDAILRAHGVIPVEEISTVRRWSMACPALPTCGLAVTEAERALPTLIDRLEAEIEAIGLADERFTIRMTGCPNGCARPYNADIGLVGRSADKNADGSNNPGTYTIFLGGRTTGERLNVVYKDYVPFDQLVPTLSHVLTRFRDERLDGESVGDFCHRVGVEALAEERLPESV
jgi:sulfite reductase (ferredoxin)